MKLLILTPYIPYPIHSGGNKAFFSLVDMLRKKIDISIILSVKNSDECNVRILKELWSDVTFYFYNQEVKNKKSFYYNLLDRMETSIQRKIKRLKNHQIDIVRDNSIIAQPSFYESFDEEFINWVYKIIEEGKFDLIQVDFFDYISIINILPSTVKKIFTHHELRFVRAEQELGLLKQINPIDLYLFNSIKKYEIENLDGYDAVVTLTDVDRIKLMKVLRNDIYIEDSPPIVDIKASDSSSPFHFNNKLVFLGGCDHFPNLDGVDWFLNNCWEDLRLAKPELEFHIIGQWKSKLRKKYTKEFDNVFFSGYVDDLSVALTDTIMIVPLRIGSGVRIKILDAISKGVPFISTSIGAEGIELDSKKDCIIADDKSLLVESILKLAVDDNLCDQLRFSARQKLNARLTAQELALKRLHIYQNVLNIPHTN